MRQKLNYSGKTIRQIAELDVSNPAVNWEEKNIKPGESFLKNETGLIVADLQKKYEQFNNDLEIKVKAKEFAKLTEEQSIDETKEELVSEYEQKKADYIQRKTKLEKGKKSLTETEKTLRYTIPVQEEEVEVKKNPIEENKSKKGKTNFLVLLLILICLYDGLNMLFGLNNFKYELFRNSAIAFTSFGFVLFASLNVKKKNDFSSWVIFLLALSISNIPQFLGNPVVFSLSNLVSSPYNIIAFLISFIGSIAITIMNARDGNSKVNIPEPLEATESIQSVIDNETQESIKTYKQVVKRIGEIDGELQQINISIEDLDKQKERHVNDLESGLLNFKKQKLEALLQFDSEIKQLQEHIEKLNIDVADEKGNLIENLKAYRAEVELLLLLRDIGKEANFIELNNIV